MAVCVTVSLSVGFVWLVCIFPLVAYFDITVSVCIMFQTLTKVMLIGRADVCKVT